MSLPFFQEPICYFSFVLDPTSFGRTVENMFYTSFLIKEGKAKIFFDDAEEGRSKMPLIVPMRKRKYDSEADSSNGGDSKNQVLMKISMEDWTRLKVNTVLCYKCKMSHKKYPIHPFLQLEG